MWISLFLAVLVNNLQNARDKLDHLKKKARKQRLRKARPVPSAHQHPLHPLRHHHTQKNNHHSSADSNSLLNDKLPSQQDSFQQNLDTGFGLDEYYPPSIPQRKKELMSQYFMLLGSLEYCVEWWEEKSRVLDDLVDMGAGDVHET